MLSLASLWPTLNEPVLRLSCVIMNIHRSVCENLCVCAALAGIKEAITIYSITICHFVWIISQADNNCTYRQTQTKQALFWAKEEPSLFPVLKHFKSNVAVRVILLGPIQSFFTTFVCIHTNVHTLPLSLMLDESSGLKKKKKERLEFPLCHLGTATNIALNTTHTRLEIIFVHTQGPFLKQSNVVLKQMCTSQRGC